MSTQGISRTSSVVEEMPVLPATEAGNGLGFNVGVTEWEFKMARDAGATTVRWHPGWNGMEDMDGNLLAPAQALEDPLSWAASLGLRPIVVTGYGPPWRALDNRFTVAAATPAGTKAIPVAEPVDAVEPPRCHVLKADGTQLVPRGRWAYSGALIHDVDPAAGTIELAHPTNVALAAGDTLVINKLLYPSAATASPDDPSVAAFVRYAEHVASRVGAHVSEGSVEIWNEPPWAHDPWDARYRFYDEAPPELEVMPGSHNWGFYRRLLRDGAPPAGVGYISSATHKTGFNTLFGPRMATLFTREQAERIGIGEAYHPYGASPEHHGWLPSCVENYTGGNIFADCALEGTNTTSNIKWGHWVLLKHLKEHGWTISEEATEVGIESTNETAKARGVLRQFLYYLAAGFQRITFYHLTAGATAFVNHATREPLPAYTAIKRLMDAVNDIAVAPADATAATPSVSSYTGSYPLMTVPVLGREKAPPKKDTLLLMAWQRSYPPDPVNDLWTELPPPAPGSATVRLAPGERVVDAVNLTTGDAVPTTHTGHQATFPVTDDPVMLRVRR